MVKKINKNFIIYLLTIVFYSVAILFFTVNLLKLTGIENMIRIIILILFFLLGILYLIGAFIFVVNRTKKKLFIGISIALILLTIILGVGSFYINKTLNKMDNINKEKITYTTNLLTLKDNDKLSTLAMIDDINDIEGYKLANELIKKNNLDHLDITYYEDYTLLINALYDEEIDGIFLSSNYDILFNDEFKNIDSDLEVKYEYSEELDKIESAITSNKKLNEPFSILLIGVDSISEKLNANQAFNGDTLMIITFNPHTLNATMFSIPRDTYTEIACKNGKKNKINTSAYYGTSCVIDTVETLTDIDIDYYVKINFKGVVNLVDALGGIDVDVPYAFCEQNSNRQWGKNTIFVEKGLQHLNGEQALALSRNRHNNSGRCEAKYTFGNRNDFVRGQNQQLVVTGMAKSIKNINSIKKFYNILDTISNSIDTNLDKDKLLSFYEVIKNMLMKLSSTQDDFINIEKTYLMTYNQTINSRSMELYYLESLKEIVDAMKINLELEEPTLIKTFEFSVNEEYEKKVIGKDRNGGVNLEDTVPDFTNKSRLDVNTWASARNIKVNYIEVTEENPLYKNEYTNGQIIKQNPKKSVLVSEVNSITIYIIKKSSSINTETNTEDEIDQNIKDLIE